MIRLVSVNTFNLYGSASLAEQARHAAVEDLIRGLNADIIAVQEIVAREPVTSGGPSKRDAAAEQVRRLADAVDRRCELDGTPVFALGGGHHHVALLWRDGIVPVPGTVGRFERDPAGMWHSLVTAVVDLGGARLRVGSVQLSPFDQGWGHRDAGQILRALQSDTVPGLVGGDFNGIGATEVAGYDGYFNYDPTPYRTDVPWHPDFAYQHDDDGQLDRRVARRLERVGRMRDCARIAGAPWAPTSGHHPGDAHPPRRVDRWYASHHFPDDAITAYRVLSPDDVGDATDHAPIEITVDEQLLQEVRAAD